MVGSGHRELIAREAAEWLVRLRQPGNRAAASAEFADWLTSSPECIEEYLAMTLAWEALEEPARSGLSSDALIAAARAEPALASVATLPRDMPPPRAPSRSWLRTFLPVAAAVVLVFVGWAAWQRWAAVPLYVTAAHEERTVTLRDGSRVSLAPSSAIEVHWSTAERRVALDHGRARFQDVDDPRRPFIVVTAHGAVEAVGTIFDVETDRTDTKVKVLDGRVEVGLTGSATSQNGAPLPLVLDKGDHATLWGGTASRQGARPPGVIAWTAGRLVVRSVPLRIVLEQFGGGDSGRYVLDGPSLAALRISGIFDPRDVGPLLRYLERYEGLRIHRSPDGIVHLSGSPSPRR